MKSIITLTSIIILGLFSNQAKASDLYLTMPSGTHTSIEIAGYQLNTQIGNVSFDHLPPGYHRLKVTQRIVRYQGRHDHYRGRGRHQGHGRHQGGHGGYHRLTDVHNHEGVTTTFIILYDGYIDIPDRSSVTARISPRGELFIDAIVRYTPPRRKAAVSNRHNNFDLLIQDLNYLQFDSDKLRIAKDFVRRNGAYSNDVLDIINTFSFESTRLSFAKFAFDHTRDQENYYLVEQGFEFRSSSRELRRYIYR